MLKSKFMACASLVALLLLSSPLVSASAPGPGPGATSMPGPAVIGLIAAAVIGAIVLSRSRK